MTNTQAIGATQLTQYQLPLSSYDLTQINVQPSKHNKTKLGGNVLHQPHSTEGSPNNRMVRGKTSGSQDMNSSFIAKNQGAQNKTDMGNRRNQFMVARNSNMHGNVNYDSTPINVINNSLNITIYNGNTQNDFAGDQSRFSKAKQQTGQRRHGAPSMSPNQIGNNFNIIPWQVKLGKAANPAEGN